MLKAMFHRYISSFERRYAYDASYMRELIDTSPSAFFRFGLVASLGQLSGAPAAATAAVGIVGTLREDCGPCTQIGVDLSLEKGVDPQILRAVLAGDEPGMGEDAALAYRYARAVLDHRVEADALREQIIARWGKRGLVALALALTMSRLYPTLKYALGHGRSCGLIRVAGAPVALPASA